MHERRWREALGIIIMECYRAVQIYVMDNIRWIMPDKFLGVCVGDSVPPKSKLMHFKVWFKVWGAKLTLGTHIQVNYERWDSL